MKKKRKYTGVYTIRLVTSVRAIGLTAAARGLGITENHLSLAVAGKRQIGRELQKHLNIIDERTASNAN